MEPMRELKLHNLNITYFRDSKGRLDVDIYTTDRFSGDEQLSATLNEREITELIRFLKEALGQ